MIALQRTSEHCLPIADKFQWPANGVSCFTTVCLNFHWPIRFGLIEFSSSVESKKAWLALRLNDWLCTRCVTGLIESEIKLNFELRHLRIRVLQMDPRCTLAIWVAMVSNGIKRNQMETTGIKWNRHRRSEGCEFTLDQVVSLLPKAAS